MKTLVTVILLLITVTLSAQNEQIISQIDQSTTFEQMPVLKLTVARKTNMLEYSLTNGKLERRNATTAQGKELTLYFPAQIYDSGRWSRAEEKYNYISTSPQVTDSTTWIHRNLVSYLSQPDMKLLMQWLNKYEQLGKIRMEAEQPTTPPGY
jgi:hypothetical protein